MRRIWGWNSHPTEYSLEGIQTVTLFPHFVIKEKLPQLQLSIAFKIQPEKVACYLQHNLFTFE